MLYAYRQHEARKRTCEPNEDNVIQTIHSTSNSALMVCYVKH